MGKVAPTFSRREAVIRGTEDPWIIAIARLAVLNTDLTDSAIKSEVIKAVGGALGQPPNLAAESYFRALRNSRAAHNRSRRVAKDHDYTDRLHDAATDPELMAIVASLIVDNAQLDPIDRLDGLDSESTRRWWFEAEESYGLMDDDFYSVLLLSYFHTEDLLKQPTDPTYPFGGEAG